MSLSWKVKLLYSCSSILFLCPDCHLLILPYHLRHQSQFLFLLLEISDHYSLVRCHQTRGVLPLLQQSYYNIYHFSVLESEILFCFMSSQFLPHHDYLNSVPFSCTYNMLSPSSYCTSCTCL